MLNVVKHLANVSRKVRVNEGMQIICNSQRVQPN